VSAWYADTSQKKKRSQGAANAPQRHRRDPPPTPSRTGRGRHRSYPTGNKSRKAGEARASSRGGGCPLRDFGPLAWPPLNTPTAE